jgi:hypothetical protein
VRINSSYLNRYTNHETSWNNRDKSGFQPFHVSTLHLFIRHPTSELEHANGVYPFGSPEKAAFFQKNSLSHILLK